MSTKVSWKKLKSHRGSSAGITARMEDYLTSRDSLMAYLELSEFLVHDTKWKGGPIAEDLRWVEATAPAIAFLLSRAMDASFPARVFALVAELVGAPHEKAWLAPATAPLPHDVLDTLEAHFAVLEEEVASQDAAVRASVCMVLTLVAPPKAQAAADLLRGLVNTDPVATVRASALLGLARVAGSSDIALIEQLSTDTTQPDLVRGAAALALLRLEPSRSPSELGDALEIWLSQPPTGDTEAPLCWFHSDVGGPNRPQEGKGIANGAWAIHVLAQHMNRWEAWRDDLVDLGCSTTSPMVRRSVSDLLWLNELPSGPGYRLLHPDCLSSRQLELLERIADKWLCVPPRHGLPAGGPTRMRYFGWAEPSLMEREVEVEIDGATVKRTIGWTKGSPGKAVDGTWAIAHDERTLPEIDALSPAMRWRALAEICVSMGAPNGFSVTGDQLERVIDAAVADPDLSEAAVPLLDEVSAWYGEARAQQTVGEMDPETSRLLITPAVRTEVRFKPEWEVFLGRDLPEDDGRAIIECFEEHRREPWLLANPQYYQRLAAYIDLVPSAEFVRRYWSKIQAKRKAGTLKPKSQVLERRILELAESVPLFAEVVRQADQEP